MKEFPEISTVELLPLLLNIDNEIIWIILVYRPPGGQKNIFFYQLLQELRMIEETCHHRMILCVDFHMDQMFQENVNALQVLLQEFNLC